MTAKTVIMCAALLAMAAPALPSQWARVEAQSSDTCADAARAVRAGDRSPAGRRALDRLGSCGKAAVSAAASALRHSRAARDKGYLTQVTSFIQFAPDGEMLDAALEVAQDGSASIEARVVAMLAIYHLEYPHHDARYEDVTRVVEPPMLPDCRSGIVVGVGTQNRLTPAAQARVRTAMRRIRSNQREPTQVRAAAACVGT